MPTEMVHELWVKTPMPAGSVCLGGIQVGGLVEDEISFRPVLPNSSGNRVRLEAGIVIRVELIEENILLFSQVEFGAFRIVRAEEPSGVVRYYLSWGGWALAPYAELLVTEELIKALKWIFDKVAPYPPR